jgi:hypothetical protein
MSIVEIEEVVKSLPDNDLHELMMRLSDFANDRWDRQIEEDAKNGRLDGLIAKAREEVRQGKTTPL